MGYDKGQPKATSQADPLLVDEKKVRKYRAEIDRLLNLIKSHNNEIASLQSEKSGIKDVLEEQYEDHKVEVAKLYTELGQKEKAFQLKCETYDAAIIEKQAKIDEQTTQLETTAISIADDQKNLVEKENELIQLSNETIGRQQSADNSEEYLTTVRASIKNQKQEIVILEAQVQVKIDEQARLNNQKVTLQRDLDIKINQHDARVEEVNSQIKELKKVIEEYKQIQADAFIAQEKKKQFEKEVEVNRQYAAKLKETEATVQNRDHQVTVREKANKLLSKDIQTRLKIVQGLEAKYGRQQNG